MTNEELTVAVDKLEYLVNYQHKEIQSLNERFEWLKQWSDLNDHYLEELLNNLVHTVGRLNGLPDDERDLAYMTQMEKDALFEERPELLEFYDRQGNKIK